MKEISIREYYKGIYLTCIVVVKFIKDAGILLDTNAYNIKTYGNVGKPRTKLAIDNPYLRLAKFEKSGEIPYFIKEELIGIPMKYIDAKHLIDEHRRICGSYSETIKWHEKLSR